LLYELPGGTIIQAREPRQKAVSELTGIHTVITLQGRIDASPLLEISGLRIEPEVF